MIKIKMVLNMLLMAMKENHVIMMVAMPLLILPSPMLAPHKRINATRTKKRGLLQEILKQEKNHMDKHLQRMFH